MMMMNCMLFAANRPQQKSIRARIANSKRYTETVFSKVKF